MQKLYRGLLAINVIGAVIYILICGIALAMGHAIYPGQAMLLGQVVFGIILAVGPGLIGKWRHFKFPLLLLVIWEAFILGAVLLGTGMQFYNIPYWDKFLHLFSASMLAGLGLAIFGALTPKQQLQTTKPLLLAIVAVAFGTKKSANRSPMVSINAKRPTSPTPCAMVRCIFKPNSPSPVNS